MAERANEVTELKRDLAQALRDKEQLQKVKQQHQVHTVLYITGCLPHCVNELLQYPFFRINCAYLWF